MASASRLGIAFTRVVRGRLAGAEPFDKHRAFWAFFGDSDSAAAQYGQRLTGESDRRTSLYMSNRPDISQEAIDLTVDALGERIDDPSQPASFQELRTKLFSIRDLRRLSRRDQLLFLALMEQVSNERKLNTIDSYGRQVLKAAAILTGRAHRPELCKLFASAAEYNRRGVWTTTDSKYNARVSGVKAVLDAAVSLDIITHNHLEHLKTKKTIHNPRPASDEALKSAVTAAIDTFNSKAGAWAIIAFRNLVMLDWKSYGPRSHELAGLKRKDFLPDPNFGHISESKSANGNRRIPIDTSTAVLTNLYLIAVDAYRARKKQPPLGNSDPLFISLKKHGVTRKTISTVLSELLPDGVRPHDLRSRIATELARNHHSVDVGAALGIHPESTKAYIKAAGDAENRAVLASLHAQVALRPKFADLLGVPAEMADPRQLTAGASHLDQPSPTTESDCWLPDAYLEELDSQEAA